jgi:hypothetical protein
MSVIRIPSDKLTPYECYSGVNLAFWSMKYAYLNLEPIQKQLQSEANYELSDKIRDVMQQIERGYSYKLGPIKDQHSPY